MIRCLELRRPLGSTLFPYTTLFRSLGGNALEARAKAGTSRAIRKLVDLRPTMARVRRDGVDKDVAVDDVREGDEIVDRKSTRLNSSHSQISYAVFCLKKKKNNDASP